MAATKKTPALAYLRVSGKGQVHGDGLPRQRDAIARYARKAGVDLVAEYADEGVSGTLGLADRPGLTALVEHLSSNGVRLVIVEKADRLARDLIEGELILRELRKLGARVIEAEGGNDVTEGDQSNPTAKLIRQILGAVSEFERDAVVMKLRAARNRKRRSDGRCEGVKPFGFRSGESETLVLLRGLARPKRGQRTTYAAVAIALTEQGRPTRSGKPWTSSMVRNLLRDEKRRS